MDSTRPTKPQFTRTCKFRNYHSKNKTSVIYRTYTDIMSDIEWLEVIVKSASTLLRHRPLGPFRVGRAWGTMDLPRNITKVMIKSFSRKTDYQAIQIIFEHPV